MDMGFELGEELSEKADNINRRFHGPINGSGLCYRCNNAMIMRRKGEFEPKILCDELATSRGRQQVPTDVEECTKFSQVGKLSIWDLAKLAKVIETEPPKSVGFTPAAP